LAELYYFNVPGITWLIVAVLCAVILLATYMLIIPLTACRIVVNDSCVSLKAGAAVPKIRFCSGDVEGMTILEGLPKELRPTLRLNGYSLPGFKWGWFKLSNGAKAFVAVSGSNGKYIVVLLKDGTYVIIKPKNPDKVFVRLAAIGFKIRWPLRG